MERKVLLSFLLIGILLFSNVSFAVHPDFNKMNAKELGEWVEKNSEGKRMKGYGIPSQENNDGALPLNSDSGWIRTRRHQNSASNYWHFLGTMYSVAEWKADDSLSVIDYRKVEHTLQVGNQVIGGKEFTSYKPNSGVARMTFTGSLADFTDDVVLLVHTYWLRGNGQYEYALEEL